MWAAYGNWRKSFVHLWTSAKAAAPARLWLLCKATRSAASVCLSSSLIIPSRRMSPDPRAAPEDGPRSGPTGREACRTSYYSPYLCSSRQVSHTTYSLSLLSLSHSLPSHTTSLTIVSVLHLLYALINCFSLLPCILFDSTLVTLLLFT